MFFSRWIRQTVAATTLTSLVVPVSLVQAAESLPLQSDSPVQKEVAPAVKPIHFKLAQGGKMAGVIHDQGDRIKRSPIFPQSCPKVATGVFIL